MVEFILNNSKNFCRMVVVVVLYSWNSSQFLFQKHERNLNSSSSFLRKPVSQLVPPRQSRDGGQGLLDRWKTVSLFSRSSIRKYFFKTEKLLFPRVPFAHDAHNQAVTQYLQGTFFSSFSLPARVLPIVKIRRTEREYKSFFSLSYA